MSKAEILNALPQLASEERREILERLFDLDEHELLTGGGPTPAETALLDRELEDYRNQPGAGAPWADVEARLGKSRSR